MSLKRDGVATAMERERDGVLAGGAPAKKGKRAGVDGVLLAKRDIGGEGQVSRGVLAGQGKGGQPRANLG